MVCYVHYLRRSVGLCFTRRSFLSKSTDTAGTIANTQQCCATTYSHSFAERMLSLRYASTSIQSSSVSCQESQEHTPMQNQTLLKQNRRQLPDQLALLEKQVKHHQSSDDNHNDDDDDNNNNNSNASTTLSTLEQALLVALQEHRSQGSTRATMAQLRQCYENLEYWEYALQTEQDYEDIFLYKSDNTQEMADSWSRQALYWRRLDQHTMAVKMYHRALEVLTSDRSKAPIWIALAGIHFVQERYTKSLELLQQAQPHCADQDIAIECWQHQGLVLSRLENFSAALECYQQALILTQQNDPENRIDLQVPLRLALADAYEALNHASDGLHIYQELMVSAQDRKDIPLEATLHYSMGKLLAQQCKHAEAVVHLERAVELQRNEAEAHCNGIDPALAQSLNVLGSVYAASPEQKADAMRCFQECLLIARAMAYCGDDSNDASDPFCNMIIHNIMSLQKK